MGKKKGLGRRQKGSRHAKNIDDEQKNNPTNSPNPPNLPNTPNPPNTPKNTATVETAKDPPIHASNQREESLAINLNAALDDDVLDESPPIELKNTTIDQTKNSPTIVANSERRKIWTKVTVRVNDEVSTLTPMKNISREGQSITRMWKLHHQIYHLLI